VGYTLAREREIITDRLILYPLSDSEIEEVIAAEPDEGMKQAYSEMLAGCRQHPKQRIWHSVWNMQLKDNATITVGDLSFKGLNSNGMVEIGYGIKQEYEGQGLMTEAVLAMVLWASAQPGVSSIEAETDPGNLASQRVLEKAGFVLNGQLGEEGPRYEWKGTINSQN